MKLNWESALLMLLVLEILLFGALNPRMLDINMLLFSTSDFICIGIVALPLTLVIVSGGIDISLGSTIGLCAIALGVMMQAGWPMAVAIPLTLLLGLLCRIYIPVRNPPETRHRASHDPLPGYTRFPPADRRF